MFVINPSDFSYHLGVCTNGTAPSVSSINRILRNRAAERAAAEFARNYQLAAAATAAHYGQPHAPMQNAAAVMQSPANAMLSTSTPSSLFAGKLSSVQ